MRAANDLATCVGYRVDSPDGRVGSVAAVLPPGEDRLGTFLVHTGLLQCTLSAVSVQLIERIDRRIDSNLGQCTRKHGSRVQVSKCGGWRRIRQIISWNVNSLY